MAFRAAERSSADVVCGEESEDGSRASVIRKIENAQGKLNKAWDTGPKALDGKLVFSSGASGIWYSVIVVHT
jgi:hypothetical protein